MKYIMVTNGDEAECFTLRGFNVAGESISLDPNMKALEAFAKLPPGRYAIKLRDTKAFPIDGRANIDSAISPPEEGESLSNFLSRIGG